MTTPTPAAVLAAECKRLILRMPKASSHPEWIRRIDTVNAAIEQLRVMAEGAQTVPQNWIDAVRDAAFDEEGFIIDPDLAEVFDEMFAAPVAAKQAEPDHVALVKLLDGVRAIRDHMPWGHHRSTMNAAIDRLDVVASKLAHGDNTPAKDFPDHAAVAPDGWAKGAASLAAIARQQAGEIEYLCKNGYTLHTDNLKPLAYTLREAAALLITPPASTDRAMGADGRLPLDVPAEILAVAERLHTQDNRITDNPLFAVQQKRKTYGLDPDYAEHCEFVVDGEVWAPENEGDEPPDDARELGWVERWEFVTGCLTEQGCKDFIRVNGHNLHEPRIYAYSSYRNAEFIALRNWLMSLTTPPSGATSAEG